MNKKLLDVLAPFITAISIIVINVAYLHLPLLGWSLMIIVLVAQIAYLTISIYHDDMERLYSENYQLPDAIYTFTPTNMFLSYFLYLMIWVICRNVDGDETLEMITVLVITSYLVIALGRVHKVLMEKR